MIPPWQHTHSIQKEKIRIGLIQYEGISKFTLQLIKKIHISRYNGLF